MPPPSAASIGMDTLLRPEERQPIVAPPPASPGDLQERIARQADADGREEAVPPEDTALLIRSILRDMADEAQCTFRPTGALFQDFTVRCREHGIRVHGLDVVAFRQRFSAAVAGLDEEPAEDGTARIIALSGAVPEELLTPFLTIAKAAMRGEPCPSDEELARVYGTNSLGRVRRMMDNLEKCGAIVVRTDFAGRRTVAVPGLDLTTLATS
jgi:hypothetical protein